MKKLLWIGLIILFLSGCAGLPEPEGSGSSLVIGSLEMDFPDGFFSTSPNPSPKMFNTGIELSILNTTSGQSFKTSTSNGYFYFLSNGTDSYKLENYKFTKKVPGAGNYTINGGLNHTFDSNSNNLLYLGNFIVTYKQPDKISTDTRGGSKWNYATSLKISHDAAAMMNFIREKNPESSWLSYEPYIMEWDKK